MATFPWKLHRDPSCLHTFCICVYWKFKRWWRYNFLYLSYLRHYITRIVSCLFMLYLPLHKFLKVSFEDQYLYCFYECMTLLCIRAHDYGGKKNLSTFLMFKLFFIGYGYYRKSFPNTLICIFMRGAVMSLENVKWSWTCSLLLFLDVLIRD